MYGWSSYCLVSYDDALCDYIKCETYTGSDFRRSVERPFLFPIVIFFLSLLIPMQLKFGVEKSRLVMIGVSVFVGMMIYYLAEKSGMLDGNSAVVLSAFDLTGGLAVDVIGLLIAAGLAVGSYLCSCRIMKKKEL